MPVSMMRVYEAVVKKLGDFGLCKEHILKFLKEKA